MIEPQRKSDFRPLALLMAVVMALLAVTYRLAPGDLKAWLLFPVGTWAMFCGARLSLRVGLPLVIIVFGLSDVFLYVSSGYSPNRSFYPCLIVWYALGSLCLTSSHSIFRIVPCAITGSLTFFLITNFASWLEPALPEYEPHTFETLLLAYRKGIEFLRMQPGQLEFGIVSGIVAFKLHHVLARAYFPAEEIALEGAR